MIKVEKTIINDINIFYPTIFNDDRGYFFESYNKKDFNNLISDISFVQDNESKSKFGVLRGFHYQKSPFEQSKLVRVLKGEIQDVVVDLRTKSQTYKKHVSIILNEDNKKQVYIPKGCAHAFLTLSDEAIINYKVDNYHNTEYDSGVRFDDPIINVKWKLNLSEIKLSEKDKKLPFL